MINKTTEILGYITAVILALLVLLIVYDATARYLFSSGSTALQELEWHFYDVVILLSIAYTFKYNAHVRVDIFYDTFSIKNQTIINIVAIFVFIIPFSLLICYIGIGFVEMSFVQHEASSNPGGLTQRWVVKSLMPLSFMFVALQGVSELMRNIRLLKKLS